MVGARRLAPAFAQKLRRAGRPEMPFCECVTGPAFQVFLEMLCLLNRIERDVQFELSRHEFRRVGAPSRVMVCHSLAKVSRMTKVTLVRMVQALDDVGVEHITACHP